MGMESGRGPGGCNLLSVANTQQMCGAEDWERRGGSQVMGWGCCREGTQTVGALSRPAGSLSAVTSPPALRPDRFISTTAHTRWHTPASKTFYWHYSHYTPVSLSLAYFFPWGGGKNKMLQHSRSFLLACKSLPLSASSYKNYIYSACLLSLVCISGHNDSFESKSVFINASDLQILVLCFQKWRVFSKTARLGCSQNYNSWNRFQIRRQTNKSV